MANIVFTSTNGHDASEFTTSPITTNGSNDFDETAILAQVSAQLPGRHKQIQHLLHLFGSPATLTMPSIFVYGSNAVGKTCTVQLTLAAMKAQHAFVDCLETYTPRLLYEHILNQLSGQQPSEANGFTGYGRCDSMPSFTKHLTDIIDQQVGTC
jgi:origin recognition complex subunit 5